MQLEWVPAHTAPRDRRARVRWYSLPTFGYYNGQTQALASRLQQMQVTSSVSARRLTNGMLCRVVVLERNLSHWSRSTKRGPAVFGNVVATGAGSWRTVILFAISTRIASGNLTALKITNSSVVALRSTCEVRARDWLMRGAQACKAKRCTPRSADTILLRFP